MLAKTSITDLYLTAVELGITEAEREALIWVREELATGRIDHDPKYAFGNAFNMTFFDWECECGTSHCIGGWMRVRLGGRKWDVNQTALLPLFYPFCGAKASLTPVQAVRAIDAFGTGAGDNCWHFALKQDA